MKKLLFALIIFSFSKAAFAQPPAAYRGGANPGIKGKITGTLTDKETGEPVEYATVSVINKKTTKLVNGGLTETGGSFKIQDLPIGEYLVEFSFVGFIKLTKEVTLTPKSPDADLGNVSFEPDVQALDEVVVEGQREVFENKIDRIVYNAAQDIGNAGGDATDVLRRTPLLSVDLEGNVSLRGSQNIQILVNGKPSTMFASNPGEALRSIPSDQIKSIEVITSPGAKYDGEGTAGIINIVTKKQGPEGFTGNVDLSIGNLQNRGSANIAAGRGRFGFNASASSYYSIPRDATSELYRLDRVGELNRILTENGTQESYRLGFFGNAGAFYDFNAFHSISTSFNLRGFTSGRDGNFFTTYTDEVLNLNQTYDRYTNSEQLFSGYEWSLDYIYKFPQQKGRELALSYKIDGNIQDQEAIVRQNDLEGNSPQLFRDEQNFNDGNNREDTYQVDYTHPVSEKLKIEAGAKAIIRNIDSDFRYDSLNQSTGNYVEIDNRSDIFFYDQDVYAGYLSTTWTFSDKLGLIAGARYEATQIAGNFEEFEQPFENQYENILPSITLSTNIGKANTVKMSYNRRIQRPSLGQVNPFIDLNNNRFLSYGNPELEPELSDQYEVSYSTFKNGKSINASVYYRRTTDLIESIRLDNQSEVSETTFLNVGTNNSIGVNLFTSATFFKIWTLRGGANIFTYDATGSVNGQDLSNQAILFNANGNTSIKLPKDWIIEAFGFYRAPRQTIQGFNPSFSIWSMAIQKTIWEGRGKVGLRAVELFQRDKSFGSELEGENFYQFSDFTIPFRSFGVTFSYKFGKIDFKQRTRRSRISNTDQEEQQDNGF
jgi:outer membrane receptor protein involved in Fe transport